MDEIKRKLELIDRQLARRRFHTRVISTCPLVFVAVGLCAGIFVQSRLGMAVPIWTALLVLFAAGTALLFVVQQFSCAEFQYVTAYLALGCFVCLGAVRLTAYGTPTANDIRLSVGDQRKLATIRGLIVTEPYVNTHADWQFAQFRPTVPGTSFYLKIDHVETAAGWAPVTGTIRVQVGDSVENLQADEPVKDLEVGETAEKLRAGARIEAYCWLERFGPPTNPGQFDSASYLARRNIFVGASVRSRGAITVLESHSAGALVKLRARVSQAAAAALVGDVDQKDEGRGLLQALLLGDRREIPGDTYMAFRKTGLLHFISLSGMHMGILVGLIWWACRTAGLMKPARAVICSIAVVVFLLVVPPRAPTVRAVIICWVFCASILFRRHTNPVNTLSLAAVILLLIRPTQLFEAGWQLSFASVLAIILFTERIESSIHDVGRQEWRWLKGFLRIVPDPRSLLAIGLAAWIGGAGVLLHHFHTINPFTSIWTVLVFPLVCAILVLGFLKMILFFLSPLSWLLGLGAGLMADILIRVVELIAKPDISQVLIGHVSLVPILAYYCALAFAGYVHILRRPLTKRIICTAMFMSLIAYLGTLKYQRTHPGNLVVTCLDVGHGQAILAQFPGGTNVLFDAGSLYRSNVGARIVLPFLNYQGIDEIDAIVVSHNDADHINGIPEIVKSCHVGGVYASDAFFGKSDEWGTVEFLRKCLRESGLEIGALHDYISSTGVSIKTLWPDESLPNINDLTDNNRSLAAFIEFAGVGILLCSDIEQFAQAELLRLYPNLKVDVVVVPHHGSARTLDPAFLQSLNAQVLICSCDQNQFERTADRASPPIDALPRAQRFYTARDGAVKLTVHKDGAIETAAFLK